ncbi:MULTISPECIES: ABC transporter permease [Micrococcaceae]|jgi:spermidine/putrescine transport system permease protein|uniref:ABC transporter permease n=1 Tax=Micrococcaceae TaxID=1268 RepID=UPI0016213313|nr:MULTISPECIES: ABC transporter permease [Micrococcaceae]MBB5749903.1 spermidine/putrescine transport system permease protein [Micrococcus sp. TA1]HRO29215.1 ABC transporter permease [Citricoccus sp.]HRO92752.1 ABC transporter permease [Citricoccus sp.]
MTSRVAGRSGRQAGFDRAAALADGTAPARGRAGYGLVSPGLVYLLVFFVLPVFTLLATSLYVKPPGAEVGQFVPALEFGNYAVVLGGYWPELLRSFGFALLATVLCLVIGYPMAYLIAVRLRGRAFVQGLLLVLLIAPFFTSFVLRTQAWKQILADEGFLVQALKTLHLMPQGASLTATSVAVVAGLTYNFLPFMVLPIYANLQALDHRLLEAGRDLYGSDLTVFRTVTLPISVPGVLAGTLLTFIPASGDFVNAAILGNNRNTTMIGQVIDSKFMRVLDYPGAAALSFILMVTILVLVTLYVRRFGTRDLV